MAHLIRRRAAFYCIGELMAVFGAQNMSFMAEIAIVSLRNLKSSSNVSRLLTTLAIY